VFQRVLLQARRFWVLTAVNTVILVFWEVSPCVSVDWKWCKEVPYSEDEACVYSWNIARCVPNCMVSHSRGLYSSFSLYENPASWQLQNCL